MVQRRGGDVGDGLKWRLARRSAAYGYTARRQRFQWMVHGRSRHRGARALGLTAIYWSGVAVVDGIQD